MGHCKKTANLKRKRPEEVREGNYFRCQLLQRGSSVMSGGVIKIENWLCNAQ